MKSIKLNNDICEVIYGNVKAAYGKTIESDICTIYNYTSGIEKNLKDLAPYYEKLYGLGELSVYDDEIKSYSYKFDDENAFVAYHYLRDVESRGSKETVDLLAFNKKILNNKYIVDLIGNDRVFQNKIKYDIVNSKEVKPDNPLTGIDPEDLILYDSDIDYKSFTDKVIKQIITLLDRIILCKKTSKKLYVLFDYNKYKSIENNNVMNLFKAAIKLLPPSMANNISFVTCSKLNAITCDVNMLIDDITEELNGERLFLFEENSLISNSSLCNILISDSNNINSWVEFLFNYGSLISTYEELDLMAKLFSYYQYETFESIEEYAEFVSVVLENLDYIKDSDDLINLFLEKLNNDIDTIRSYIKVINISVVNSLVDNIIEISGRIPTSRGFENLLKTLLFGIETDDDTVKDSHYLLVSNYINKTVNDKVFTIIYKYWKDLKEFFFGYIDSKYFLDTRDHEVINLIIIKAIEMDNNKVFDDLVPKYLASSYDSFGEICNIAFNKYSKEEAFEKLQKLCIFNYEVILSTITKKDIIVDDWIKELIKHLNNDFYAYNSIILKYEKTIAGSSTDVMKNVVTKLLENAFVFTNFSLDGLINKYNNCEAYIISSNKFIKDEAVKLFDDIVNKSKSRIISDIKIDVLNPTTISRLKEIIKHLKDEDVKDFESIINSYYSYTSNKNNIEAFSKFRIEEVKRELALLDGNTIRKMYKKFFKIDVNAELVKNGISTKNLNTPEFYKYADDKLNDYLNNKQSAVDKNRLCLEIIRQKKLDQNKIRLRSADLFKSIFEPIILALIAFGISLLMGLLICKGAFNGYNINIYLAFSIVSLIVSIGLYVFNFKERRLRSVAVMTLWESLLFVLILVGGYSLMIFAIMG